MSNLRLLDVIVKGLNAVFVLDCDGNLFTASVSLALPWRFLKSGINLFNDKKNSPSVSSVLMSKSKDLANEVIVVLLPSALTWSVPVSCSNIVVLPKPVIPLTAGNDPFVDESYLVAYGLGYTEASSHVVLASFPVYQIVALLLAVSP